LGWANLKSLQFYGGAGRARLDFSGPGPDEAAALLDPGAGDLELLLPTELSVEVTGFGVDPQSPPAGLVSGQESWLSPPSDAARRHLQVVLERKCSNLKVGWKS
jgi:hypothetical protein